MSYQKVLSFSGGRTSGYMLRREIDRIGLEEYRKQFITLFCNTGREHDATLDFVHDVEMKWGVPVIWLEYCRIPAIDIPLESLPEGRKRKNLTKLQESGDNGHWFRVVRWETAARRSDSRTPFDELLDWAKVLPNVRTRMCSVQMKLRTMVRYLGHRGIHEYASYIGMRSDESHRKLEVLANITSSEHPEFPLIDDGITNREVNEFWDSHPFQLKLEQVNGETIEGNCDGCFLKATWKRILFLKRSPEHGKWWIGKEDEFGTKADGDGRFFKKGQPYSRLGEIAKALPDAISPPSPKIKSAQQFGAELDLTEKDIPCSCTAGAYRGNQDSDDE